MAKIKCVLRPLTPYHPMFQGQGDVVRSTPRPLAKPEDAPEPGKADAQPERPIDNRNDKKDQAERLL